MVQRYGSTYELCTAYAYAYTISCHANLLLSGNNEEILTGVDCMHGRLVETTEQSSLHTRLNLQVHNFHHVFRCKGSIIIIIITGNTVTGPLAQQKTPLGPESCAVTKKLRPGYSAPKSFRVSRPDRRRPNTHYTTSTLTHY